MEHRDVANPHARLPPVPDRSPGVTGHLSREQVLADESFTRVASGTTAYFATFMTAPGMPWSVQYTLVESTAMAHG